MTRTAWTTQDITWLSEAYQAEGPLVLPAALLARHSHGSCKKTASHLKMTWRRGRSFGLDWRGTPEDAAWLAGLIDGEASVGMYGIRITTTSPEIVAKVGRICPTFKQYDRGPTVTGKPCWNLQIAHLDGIERLSRVIVEHVAIDSKRATLLAVSALSRRRLP